jgi:predicted phosphodiesterase
MRILILGDIHWQWQWLHMKMGYAHKNLGVTATIQVGDFGFYENHIKMLKFSLSKNKLPHPLYFIDGNHEDHEYLFCHNSKKLAKFGIEYLARGSVKTFGGVKFGFFGGALNVHCQQFKSKLLENSKFGLYAANYGLDNELQNAISKFNSENPQVMVTHSNPGGIGIGMRGSGKFQPLIKKYIQDCGFKTYDINDVGEDFLTDLYHGLKNKPKHWLFGHHHVIREAKVANTYFSCVGMGDHDGLFIYDTDKKDLEFFRE